MFTWHAAFMHADTSEQHLVMGRGAAWLADLLMMLGGGAIDLHNNSNSSHV
jgi:hypothetical protein